MMWWHLLAQIFGGEPVVWVQAVGMTVAFAVGMALMYHLGAKSRDNEREEVGKAHRGRDLGHPPRSPPRELEDAEVGSLSPVTATVLMVLLTIIVAIALYFVVSWAIPGCANCTVSP